MAFQSQKKLFACIIKCFANTYETPCIKRKEPSGTVFVSEIRTVGYPVHNLNSFRSSPQSQSIEIHSTISICLHPVHKPIYLDPVHNLNSFNPVHDLNPFRSSPRSQFV
ncbi:hypothetical protein CEXT_734621 [Caerostris extrusa]|uniref:Uncharacterized protein n=1 Tax=Caerostris extrusa TaxID=172846 RepID=A0AAV4U2M3_CAEEX|nr:hypothetical protein CEXT_734621 [Caerostris extrusa]